MGIKRIVFFIFLLSTALSVLAMAQDNGIAAKGLAMFSKDGKFAPFEFKRRAVGDNDILIKILYCAICHSDIHAARGDWGPVNYPIVPGHEIVGVVTKTGKDVTRFKIGDYAGIGPIIDSCKECKYCKLGLEQFCERGAVIGFNSYDYVHNEITRGGFSTNYVISEDYAIKIPSDAQIEKVAPLFCAGITTYSAIKHAGVKKGDKVGVAGFGGLGHMALQYMVALGSEVTVFDITEEKRQDAFDMGALRYVNVNDSKELEGLKDRFSFILSTIPAQYDPLIYMQMLKMDGELVNVGLPANENAPSVDINSLVLEVPRKKIYGSFIGGIKETQEMLDYSVENNIYPRVEIISVDQVDEAFENVVAGKVKFRYVIDMQTLE